MSEYDVPKLLTTNGLCTLCQRRAEWICQRCLDFYCSPECQRSDWQRHRYICFSMPGLMPAGHIKTVPQDLRLRRTTITKHMDRDQLSSSSKAKFLHINSKGSVGENISIDGTREIISLPKIHKLSEPVVIMGFTSTNICLVRLVKDSDRHLSTLNKIDALGKRAPLIDICPPVNAVALTLFNDMMSRVEILSIPDEKHVEVLYYDYGAMGIVQLSDLRIATEDILKLPRFSIMVKLINVGESPINEKIVNFLGEFEGMECQMRYCSEFGNIVEVELTNLDTGKIINEEIMKYHSIMDVARTPPINYSTSEKRRETVESRAVNDKNKDELLVDLYQDVPCQAQVETIVPNKSVGNIEDEPILSPPFDIYVFQPDLAKFKVIVLDTSALSYGYVGCIAETDLKYLVTVQEYLNRYTDNKQYYSPKLHEYCLARFENEWYRARVVKVVDRTKYTVVYLDFTNESILTSKDIRRYPIDLNESCRTNLCLIDGLPTSLKTEHVNFLKKEITTESKLLINKVKEVVQQIVVVECQDIITKMVNMGLI
ncbi:uncharacterized protein LOC128861165 [Anastrepha ludens]|uniref:uncharacterized protein LOC128861165 n=1 Tax=Anastrepha ludens TaxID=28586 RepID=UPI0023B0B8CD|nr:uncharacterized protein LOC128861165 [Anastrepha ludens]